MKFYCQVERNLLHNCVSVQFQFASLLQESYITQLKLLVVVKVVWKTSTDCHHDWYSTALMSEGIFHRTRSTDNQISERYIT
jgi:hypothetical protein